MTGTRRTLPAGPVALVDATTTPVVIAVVSNSDTALLPADSHDGHRWITVPNAPADNAGRAAFADTRTITAAVETGVVSTTEAGHPAEAVLEPLCAADPRTNRATNQRRSKPDGPAVPVPDGFWWAHLVSQANPLPH